VLPRVHQNGQTRSGGEKNWGRLPENHGRRGH